MTYMEKSSTSGGFIFENNSEVDQHLKLFQTFKPPAFKGVSDPTIAEDWLLKIGKILDGMICPKNRKVPLATFMLEGEAERWWQAQLKEKYGHMPITNIQWDDFVNVFRDWFIPPSARLVLQDKFFNLTQGSKTVMQYEAEFTSLSCYAPHYVTTQEEKCHRFLRGLRDQLQLALAPFDISEFFILVKRARRIENELNFSKYSWE
ncbi:hypothetical protein MA16_Dca017322 [Dendrobium catenatum]|uniref:Retrotransposon gag domain-containing protein n=1 Tax=Dendrobium catenatum TaxID=906689 RepID=A0A2I0XG78_9ASPA|nr:hypothetical protein MA16_Dca017322 [Dendrobium catenatum]